MVSLGTDNLVAANIHLTLSTWKRFVTATKTPIVYVEHYQSSVHDRQPVLSRLADLGHWKQNVAQLNSIYSARPTTSISCRRRT